MKVTGTATLHAPADRVWAALNDPAILVRTIPGCEQLEAVGPDKYRMTITAGVASIKGTYLGDVELTDPQPPNSFVLKASGAGAPGTVNADVTVRLEETGGTTKLRYDADAVVGGAVGGVGQRVLSGVAKKTAGEFFAAVDAVLAEGEAPAGAPAAAGEPAAAAPASDAQIAAPAEAGAEGAAEAVPAAAAAPARPAVGAVFTRPAPPPGARRPPFPVGGGQVLGVVVGAAIALLAVVIGWRLGRRSR
jgi:carbon monoxide dehydrogenase subunit G